MASPPHDSDDLVRNLTARVDLPLGPILRVEQLTGGVSSIVLHVCDGESSVIVKQARSELDVPDSWSADPRRSHVEAEALRLMDGIVPGCVPRVLAEDEDLHVIVMEAAPEDWRNYKALLLEGTASPHPSRHVGELLATWHSSTAGGNPIPKIFYRPDALVELRVEPFFLSVARKQPEFSEVALRAASFLSSDGCCLVHGDATPKNVLVSPDESQFWLLDAEVMHFGRPELDVAMWTAHLLIKGHRTEGSSKTAALALSEFASAYRASDAMDLLVDDELRVLVAAVVYARIFGTSRVDYLPTVEVDKLLAAVSQLLNSRQTVLEEFASMESFA